MSMGGLLDFMMLALALGAGWLVWALVVATQAPLARAARRSGLTMAPPVVKAQAVERDH